MICKENKNKIKDMSKVQILRAFVNLRLTAAAEEIFGLFESTIAEYEQRIDRRRSGLEADVMPETNSAGLELFHLIPVESQSCSVSCC